MPENKCVVLPAKVCNAVRKEVQQIFKDNGIRIPRTQIVVTGVMTRDSKNKPAIGPGFKVTLPTFSWNKKKN